MTAPLPDRLAQAIHDAECGCASTVPGWNRELVEELLPLIEAEKAKALREAADDVAHEVRKFEPSCQADLGYYDAHMEVMKMLRDKADRLEDK